MAKNINKVVDFAAKKAAKTGKVVNEVAEAAAKSSKNIDDTSKLFKTITPKVKSTGGNFDFTRTHGISKGGQNLKALEEKLSAAKLDRSQIKSILRNKGINSSAGLLSEEGMNKIVSDVYDSEAIKKAVYSSNGNAKLKTSGRSIDEIKNSAHKKFEKATKSATQEAAEQASKTAEQSAKTKTGSSKKDLSGEIPYTKKARKELKNNMYSTKTDYMKYKVSEEYDNAIRAFDKKDFDNPILTAMKKEGMDLDSITKDTLISRRAEAINKASGKDMTIFDKMGYYRVPQKAVAFGSTAWLVNKMAASNGQQTNSQLYGQAPY